MSIKPMLFINDDLSEGVYADSGTPASTGASYWLEGGDLAYDHKNYYIHLKNNSSERVDSVTVTLKAHGNITRFDGRVRGVLNGDTITVSYDYDTRGFGPYEEVGPCLMQVYGTGEYSVE